MDETGGGYRSDHKELVKTCSGFEFDPEELLKVKARGGSVLCFSF